jgi:hypothetical protein
MGATREITLYLWNHSKYPHVAEVMGDPDERLREQFAGLPSGSEVNVHIKPRGADNPQSYNYEWFLERNDLVVKFMGHLNAHMWQIAAEARRERRSSQW